jgi:hypothetical protein
MAARQTNQFSSGVFETSSEGLVVIDWLYDGGAIAGELGIFSLEDLRFQSEGFIAFAQESIRRVLSNSFMGYVVISDVNEGAKFQGKLTDNRGQWNDGTYPGPKTFLMRPRDEFGIVLRPNGTFQDLLDNPRNFKFEQLIYSMGHSHDTHFRKDQIVKL